MKLILVRLEDGKKLVFCSDDPAIIGNTKRASVIAAIQKHIEKKWRVATLPRIIAMQVCPLDDHPFAL